jgi:hypothetical protein
MSRQVPRRTRTRDLRCVSGLVSPANCRDRRDRVRPTTSQRACSAWISGRQPAIAIRYAVFWPSGARANSRNIEARQRGISRAFATASAGAPRWRFGLVFSRAFAVDSILPGRCAGLICLALSDARAASFASPICCCSSRPKNLAAKAATGKVRIWHSRLSVTTSPNETSLKSAAIMPKHGSRNIGSSTRARKPLPSYVSPKTLISKLASTDAVTRPPRCFSPSFQSLWMNCWTRYALTEQGGLLATRSVEL